MRRFSADHRLAAVVYSEKNSVWLRDSLVNNLHLIAEDGMWAQGKSPLPDWANPAGVFNE